MIRMICDQCGHPTVSELSRWETWHTGGEVFWDTCEECGLRYEVSIDARPTRTNRKEQS